ncbi:MAG: hypothetical protein ACFFCS_10080 [Candidatus Hodarchaeota archaeon]
MFTPDCVCPFFQSASGQSINDTLIFDFNMDLSVIITKLFFETGGSGKVEKKLGDLQSIAVCYWPIYLVPIDDSNAYVLDGKNLYSQKVKTKVDMASLPGLNEIDEGSIDSFVKSLEKHVGKMEGFKNFKREEKKIDGMISKNAFGDYFIPLLKKLEKPYNDNSFSLEPTLTANTVDFMHEEIKKVFDTDVFDWARNDASEVQKLCEKWIEKIELDIQNQEQDPVLSLKKKAEWNYPVMPTAVDGLIDTLKGQITQLRNNEKNEALKESIIIADQAASNSNEINKIMNDYAQKLKDLEQKIRQEEDIIAGERNYWQDTIERIKVLLERERNAAKGFEDDEKSNQSRFLEERTIRFKTDRVVVCGVPIYLLNFVKKGKMTTLVRAPVLLEPVGTLRKTPFMEPKGYSEFEKTVSDWLLKSQNEYEIQKNIKNQDMLALPNLKIYISDGIDKLLDLDYLKKKKHTKLQEEIHEIITPND